jgi:hypothetical protein
MRCVSSPRAAYGRLAMAMSLAAPIYLVELA